MTVLEDLANGDTCDVPVEVTLKNGERVVFWCDGARGGPNPELTGRGLGIGLHLPVADAGSARVLSKQEYEQLGGPCGFWRYRK
jgi:hypothetical protein